MGPSASLGAPATEPDEQLLDALAALGALAPGQSIGGFELVAPVARGGMAVVWRARRAGEKVAIKTLLPILSADVRFERMFLAEAKLASRIAHPNVVRVVGSGEDGDVLYIAMEWIEGATLAALARVGPLPFAIAARIGVDVARGLHAAHEIAGEDGAPLAVVHRDVSPQNVLVTKEGVAKIADFGVAKAAASSERLTQSGYLKGKVEYMSPEQAYCEPVDRRTDVFALGVVLYEATTGTHPFARATQAATLARISTAEPFAPPSSLVADYPPALARVVEKALAFDPDARYATMEALADDLDQVCATLGGASAQDVAALVAARAGAPSDGRGAQLRAALASASKKRPGKTSRSRGALVAAAIVAAGALAAAAIAWRASGDAPASASQAHAATILAAPRAIHARGERPASGATEEAPPEAPPSALVVRAPAAATSHGAAVAKPPPSAITTAAPAAPASTAPPPIASSDLLKTRE